MKVIIKGANRKHRSLRMVAARIDWAIEKQARVRRRMQRASFLSL